MNRVLLDTGPLVAIWSRDDAKHQTYLDRSRSIPRPMVTCWPVVTEASWLLRDRSEAIRGLFRMFQDGTLCLARLDEGDMPPLTDAMND